MKLTPLAKAFIALVVLGVITVTIYANRESSLLRPFFSPQQPAEIQGAGAKPSTPGAPPVAALTGRPRIVIGVNDFGGAYPALVANDGPTAGPGSLFSKAGLEVEVKLVRGSKARLEEFEAGRIDVMLLTLDYLANLHSDYQKKGVDLATFFFVDWSRGNLGIVTKPGYQTIESLKKARIATTRNTPTHYFILTLLERSSLKPAEIEQVKSGLVFAKKTPDAGEMFKRGEVDAVAIWEPHLSEAVEKGGGKLLVSTLIATNLVADVLFARREFLEKNAAAMAPFLRAWLGGVEMIRTEPEPSIAIISKAFEQTPEQTKAILGTIKLATFADNRAFFGLETEGSPYQRLLADAARIWLKEGIIQAVPDAKKVVVTKYLETLRPAFTSERVVESFHFTAPKKNVPALLSKSASIYFGSGSVELDANAHRIVDGFADDMVGIFQNSFIRVEGNTDSTGNRKANIELSKRRAQTVIDYLTSRHRFDPARFVAIGNGPDRPIGDNKTAEGREWNRRTDFRVVPNY